MEQGAGTLTYDVRGRWAGAWLRGLFLPRPPLAAGSPPGIFLPELLHCDSLEPQRWGERLGGRPFVPPVPAREGRVGGCASPGLAAASLLQSDLRGEEACPLWPGAGLPASPAGGATPAHSTVTGLLGGCARGSGRSPPPRSSPAELQALGAARQGTG